MDISIVVSACGLAAQLSLWVLIAALVGGVLAGIIRVVTGMDEDVISISFRAAAVFGLIYVFADPGWKYILEFTERVWAGNDTYFIPG